MDQGSKNNRPAPSLRKDLWAAALAGIASFVAIAVYVTSAGTDNAGPWVSSAPAETVNAPSASPGAPRAAQLAAFVYKKTPVPLPDLAFTDGNGNPKSLREFRGKTVLLNLWATWCAPCREEMPSLDRLQKELGSDKFEVVALALDRGGPEATKKFLDSIKVDRLAHYVDATTRVASALRVVGLPTTLLIDPEGREIGRLPGPAHWDTAAAKQLVQAALE